MKNKINKNQFGPWALVTGASAGIGAGFARQLASEGFNLVLVARRASLLEISAGELSRQYGVECRVVAADLTDERATALIADATNELEIGLLVSNAGTGSVGKFLDREEFDMKSIIHLNATSHMSLAHHFGKKMAVRKKGGIILTGAMGAEDGVPYMANEAGTKGYILGLGKSLHEELKEFGIHLTVLVATPTETAVFYKLGFTKENSPIKPISVSQCVEETLVALSRNQVTIVPGLKFRIMRALTPGSFSRGLTGKMMKKNNNIS